MRLNIVDMRVLRSPTGKSTTQWMAVPSGLFGFVVVPSSSTSIRSSSTTAAMPDYRPRVLKVLTMLQHGSATFLSVFLAVHVSAPALALIGGSVMSSQVMVSPMRVSRAHSTCRLSSLANPHTTPFSSWAENTTKHR